MVAKNNPGAGRKWVKPTPEFWQAWRQNKNQLIAQGYYPRKVDGVWYVNCNLNVMWMGPAVNPNKKTLPSMQSQDASILSNNASRPKPAMNSPNPNDPSDQKEGVDRDTPPWER
jgi:hypothetical protein